MAKKVLGIDFGTTNCCVAYYDGNQVKVIPNIEGGRMTPSVVSFKSTELLVGDVAKRQAITNENTIKGIKRYIGSDEKIICNNKSYFPEQIASYIFAYLKYYAEEYLGEEVGSAVVTVPANYNNKQRHAIVTAAKIAELKISRIINEPTAAALAYAIDTEEKEKFLVFDWGGGTLDISILKKSESEFSVVSNTGDNYLGGDDIDNIIMEFIKRKIRFEDKTIDLDEDNLIRQRLKDAAEKAKIDLSTAITTTISLPFLSMTKSGIPYNFDYTLTRAELESLISRVIKKAILKLRDAIKDARIPLSSIKKIVLVGGSTRIPSLQNKLEDIFGKERIAKNVNADESIAVGAALQAELLNEQSLLNFQLRDITPLSLGIEAHLGKMDVLVAKNVKVPIRVIKKYSTVEDDQEAVEISIYQGESPVAKDNQHLGTIHLNDLPKGEVGKVFVYVEFMIDEDGMIHASVMNRETNVYNEIKIHSDNYMKEDVLERLVTEAKKNKDEFKAKNDEMELLNRMFARQLVLKSLLKRKNLTSREKSSYSKEYKVVSKLLKNKNMKGLREISSEKLSEEDYKIEKRGSKK